MSRNNLPENMALLVYKGRQMGHVSIINTDHGVVTIAICVIEDDNPVLGLFKKAFKKSSWQGRITSNNVKYVTYHHSFPKKVTHPKGYIKAFARLLIKRANQFETTEKEELFDALNARILAFEL